MQDFDLVIAGGRIATACDLYEADIGVRDGQIVAIADRLDGGIRRIDASGRLVMPGGIECHCHIEQESSSSGIMSADDYHTGSISAAFGGNSSFVPFAQQLHGMGIAETIDLYDSRAAPKSVIDYSYHLILSDPNPQALAELPVAFERGITSLKVFMAYDRMKIDDLQFLEVLSIARRHGALTMVHAENNDIVKWKSRQLLDGGYTEPRYHAPSRPAIAEVEAIHRAITLARFADAPLFVVHVSTAGGADLIARARAEGAAIYGETCPQYLVFTEGDLNRPGLEGAKYICSPPLRDVSTQEALWRHIRAGTFASVSSDHAPYRFDETAKLRAGPNATFAQIANGMPGIAMRLPVLFSEGVGKGRISVHDFVALSSTNAARIFGLFPAKGTIAVGSDADIAIWDPDESRTVSLADQHDAMDYTPFEGMVVKGWPKTVLSRGNPVIEDGELKAKPGAGRFVQRGAGRRLAIDPGSIPGNPSGSQ